MSLELMLGRWLGSSRKMILLVYVPCKTPQIVCYIKVSYMFDFLSCMLLAPQIEC